MRVPSDSPQRSVSSSRWNLQQSTLTLSVRLSALEVCFFSAQASGLNWLVLMNSISYKTVMLNLRNSFCGKRQSNSTSVHFTKPPVPKQPVQCLKPKIVIEESLSEEQNLFEQFRQVEVSYREQFAKTKASIEEIRKRSEEQRRIMRQNEKSLADGNRVLSRWKEDYERSARGLGVGRKHHDLEREIASIQESQRCSQLSHQDNLSQISAHKIKLTKTNLESGRAIKELEFQMGRLEGTAQYDQVMEALLKEEQIIKEHITKLERKKEDYTEGKVALFPSEQYHRKQIAIYESYLTGLQVNALQEVIRMMTEQIHIGSECAKVRERLHEKRREVKIREKDLAEKGVEVDKLTEEITNLSTILLNLYEYKG